MKTHVRITIDTLLRRAVPQREIARRTGVDPKTIRRHARLAAVAAANSPGVATGFSGEDAGNGDQTPPPRPPAFADPAAPPPPPVVASPARTVSACEPYRPWIEAQVALGRNAVSIYQDLVEGHGFTHRYNSVKRFVGRLKTREPERFDVLEFLPGEEAQVDYGLGAPTRTADGKYKRPALFVMTLKHSGKSFRKVVWKTNQTVWAQLHEEAFRSFGGCCQYAVLDNLKQGVLRPDWYEPALNPVYAALLAHYGVVADPCRVRDPNRKGTVESAIQHTQGTALKGRTFETIEAQNAWLAHWEEHWAATRIHGRKKRQVLELFREEHPHLRPLPLDGFRYFTQGTRTVDDAGLVQVEGAYLRGAAGGDLQHSDRPHLRPRDRDSDGRSSGAAPARESPAQGSVCDGRDGPALQSVARDGADPRARHDDRATHGGARSRTLQPLGAPGQPRALRRGELGPHLSARRHRNRLRATARRGVHLLHGREGRARAPGGGHARRRHATDADGAGHPDGRRVSGLLGAARRHGDRAGGHSLMTMSITELEQALRGLRLSGMSATLQARALQVSTHEMDFVEAVGWMVQDELDRRRSRLLERRFTLSGLTERKDLPRFDWTYNARLPKREILELATLKFLEAKEDILCIGPPGTGKSHVAKALALLAVERGYKVLVRDALQLVEDIAEARELGKLRVLRTQLKSVDLLLIDDLFLRKLPAAAGDELADVLMSRYERASTCVTSNRPVDDWARLLGDTVVVTPLLDRLLHHGHLLKFEGKSWRLKEAAARVAKRASTA